MRLTVSVSQSLLPAVPPAVVPLSSRIAEHSHTLAHAVQIDEQRHIMPPITLPESAHFVREPLPEYKNKHTFAKTLRPVPQSKNNPADSIAVNRT